MWRFGVVTCSSTLMSPIADYTMPVATAGFQVTGASTLPLIIRVCDMQGLLKSWEPDRSPLVWSEGTIALAPAWGYVWRFAYEL
jgi:hypothetical protein